MKKATSIQLAVGAAVAVGLVAAAIFRAPAAPSVAPQASAPLASPEVPVKASVPSTPVSAAPESDSPLPAASAPLPEDALMAQLRKIAAADPAGAIQLAREGNRRFPGSPDAAERTSILIHALAKEGLASEARGTAEDMVNHYPDTSWVREIEQFTGAHRHRNLRLGPDGALESY